MTRFTAYAVFDESGDAGVGKGKRSSRYLVVAAIVCDNLEPLRKAVIRVCRTLPRSLRGRAEIHAFETPEAARPVLSSIAALDVRIYTAIVNKRSIVERQRDPMTLLTLAYSACTGAALQGEDGMIATIDRPFTNEEQRQALLLAMADTADEMNKRLLVVVEDSHHEKHCRLLMSWRGRSFRSTSAVTMSFISWRGQESPLKSSCRAAVLP